MTNQKNALLAAIQRRQRAREACAAHEFHCIDGVGWRCGRCAVEFDPGEVLAYVQGLTHGRAGHALVSDGQALITTAEPSP